MARPLRRTAASILARLNEPVNIDGWRRSFTPRYN